MTNLIVTEDDCATNDLLIIEKTINNIADHYAAFTREISVYSTVVDDSWNSLCEVARSYSSFKQWITESQRNFIEPVNFSSIEESNRQFLILKISSHLEISFKDLITRIISNHFPQEILDRSDDDFMSVRNNLIKSLKDVEPFGMNASFPKMLTKLEEVSKSCSGYLKRNFEKGKFDERILNEIIDIRNKIAHGSGTISIDENLMVYGLIYSFELSRVLTLMPLSAVERRGVVQDVTWKYYEHQSHDYLKGFLLSS